MAGNSKVNLNISN